MTQIFEYRMKPFPKTLKEAGQIANYFEGLANEAAAQGWEIHRIDSFSVTVPAGCFGFKTVTPESETIVTFRRPANQ